MPNRVYSLLDVLQQLNQDSTQYIAANPNEIVSQFIGGGETLVGSPSWSMSPWTPYPWLVANNDGPTGLWLLADPAGASFAFDSNPYSSKNPTNSMFGTVTFGQAGGLIPGLSYGKFDGTTGYLTATLATIAAGKPYTLEGWVNQAAATGNQDIMSFGQGTGGTSYIHLNAGVPKFDACVGAGTATSITSAGGALGTGVWNHIVGTYDGANMRLYVNGVLQAGPTAIATGTSSATLSMGGAGAAYWNGALFGLAIYPVALTAAQVLAHYNSAREASIYSTFYRDSFERGPGVQHTVFASIGTDSTGTLNAWTTGAGTPTITANVVSLPQATRITAGHPDWTDMILRARFLWTTGLIPQFNVHWTDVNNHVDFTIQQASLQLDKYVAGVQTTSLGTGGVISLVTSTQYWIQINITGTTFSAQIYADNAGAINLASPVGTAVTGTIGESILQAGQIGLWAIAGTCTFGGAFATVCQAIAPCPSTPGKDPNAFAGWTRGVVAGEPAFCWSKVNPYNGTYSLSIYNAHSSGDGYWIGSIADSGILAPYLLTCQARATGVGVAELGLNGTYVALATNDGTWYPVSNPVSQPFSVGPAVRLAGAGLAYFDMITISEQSSTSGFTYGTAPSRYGLFTYPNPPRRGSSQLWGTAIWGSFQWG